MFEDLLTEEQKLLRDAAREFCEKRVIPQAEHFDQAGEIPNEIYSELAELGYMGLLTPEKYGGMECDPISFALVVEQFARACAGLAICVSVQNSLASGAIIHYGSDEQKQKWLTRLAGGDIGAYALTETEAGTDAGSVRTSAVSDGDDYILNGEKLFVTSAGLSSLIIVFVSTDPQAGSKGLSAVVVETKTPGVQLGKPEKKLGLRSSDTRAISFADVRIPKANRLGDEGHGFKIALSQLNHGRLGVAAQALGIGEAAFEAARAYSLERQQFGKPISKFQAIGFKLADMRMRLDAARLLTDRALRRLMAGESIVREAAEAKLYASETANWVANEAVQIHGGYGYMAEYPVERYYRDARITTIYEGTSEAQRIVISRSVLAD